MHRVVIRETVSRKVLVHNVMIALGLLVFCAQLGWSQARLSVHWEDLTAGDFRSAIQQSQGTCLLPFGILEKHGPHLPLGTDLLDVRYAALHAAEQEYAVVFPEYYFGQIFEARHEPAPSPTADNFSCSCCRKPPTRWRGTVVRRSSS